MSTIAIVLMVVPIALTVFPMTLLSMVPIIIVSAILPMTLI